MTDDVAPLPWTVDETPNGAYLRGGDGKRFAILMGIEANRLATARYIADRINARWIEDHAPNLLIARNSPNEVSGE
jgi:hypothetical protein